MIHDLIWKEELVACHCGGLEDTETQVHKVPLVHSDSHSTLSIMIIGSMWKALSLSAVQCSLSMKRSVCMCGKKESELYLEHKDALQYV